MEMLKNIQKAEPQIRFDPEAQLIYQRGFGLTKKGRLGTAGLGPCIA